MSHTLNSARMPRLKDKLDAPAPEAPKKVSKRKKGSPRKRK